MTHSKQSVYEKSRTRFVALVFGGDCLFLLLSMIFGHLIRFQYFADFRPTGQFPALLEYWSHYCLGLLLYIVIAHNQRLFRWTVMLSRARTLVTLGKVSVLWSFSVLGIALMIDMQPEISRLFMVCSALAMIPAVLFWRFFMHLVLHRTRLFENSYRHMVIVGTGTDAQSFAQRVRSGRCDLHRFVGFLATPNHRAEDDAILEGEVFGNLENLEECMKMGEFDCVTVVDVDLPRRKLVEIAKLCERYFVDFKAVPKSFEVFSSCLEIHSLGGLPVMSLIDVPQNRFVNRLIKRAIDVSGALFGLMVSAPIFAILIPLIKRESPGPVFYRQIRVGQGGQEFSIIKLRSMKLDAEASGTVGWSTQDDPRRLKIGAFMRKWNLDEVPQFWNVLKGEMSLVGPRPERPELISDFIKDIPYYQSRHSVKPGMTGWAQVNGLRGDTSISERIRYDLQYIEKWSIWMDLAIKFKTFFNYKGAC